MAAKLELRITGLPDAFDTLTIADHFFVFRNERLQGSQIKIGVDAGETAKNIHDAFNQDVNFLGEFNTTWRVSLTDANGDPLPQGELHGIVDFEHPENDFFDSFGTSLNYIDYQVTTTPEEAEANLQVSLSAADADVCGNYKLTIGANVDFLVRVEVPIGNPVIEYLTDGNPREFQRVRRSTPTNGVVKIFNTIGALNLVDSIIFSPPTVLAITEVVTEGTPFGAAIEIKTNTKNSIEYSLNNADWQNSGSFTGLLAGNFTAYARDSYGCVKSKTFEITEDMVSGLSVEGELEMPIHNSIRFGKRSQENFLGYLAGEGPRFVNYYFTQKWLLNDSVRQQFKSPFKNHALYLIDCEGNETEISIVKKSDNIGRIRIYEGNYTNKDNRLAVFFTSGNIYNPDGSAQETGHILNGNLPIWYEEGMYINIEGVGATKIERIYFDEADEINYAVTQLDAAGDVTNTKITSIHTAHPFEVYEFDANFLVEGKFQYRLEYWNTEADWDFELSEIQEVKTELEDHLTVRWKNKYNNAIIYNTGIEQFRRVEFDKYFYSIPADEGEVLDTDTTSVLIDSTSFAIYGIVLSGMPMEVARGLRYGINNSSQLNIDGAQFVRSTPVAEEEIGNTGTYRLVPELKLASGTMDGQQFSSDVITPEFLIVNEDVNGVGFLRLD